MMKVPQIDKNEKMINIHKEWVLDKHNRRITCIQSMYNTNNEHYNIINFIEVLTR